MEKMIYVVVNGTDSSNSDGGYNGYWVNKYTKEEFKQFWNNKITFQELVGMSRVEFESAFNSEDEAWEHARELGE